MTENPFTPVRMPSHTLTLAALPAAAEREACVTRLSGRFLPTFPVCATDITLKGTGMLLVSTMDCRSLTNQYMSIGYPNEYVYVYILLWPFLYRVTSAMVVL